MNRRDWIKLPATAAMLAPASLAQVAAWKPKVLDAHQNDTVVALTETIIPATDTPGAKATLVNRYIDLLLDEGPVEQRNEFLNGLAYLDGQAIARHGQPFVRCTAEQQTTLLAAFDQGAGPGNRFFHMAKRITSRIYYSTEAGQKELNKGSRVPASYGCTHPEHK